MTLKMYLFGRATLSFGRNPTVEPLEREEHVLWNISVVVHPLFLPVLPFWPSLTPHTF